MYCTGNCQYVSSVLFSFSFSLVTILRSRGSQVSAEHIQLYQKVISANVKALEERVAEMNGKLESLAPERYQNIVSDTTERRQVLEEKASIQRLIDICLRASQYLENRQ